MRCATIEYRERTTHLVRMFVYVTITVHHYTEVPELQDVLGAKRVAPTPLQPKPLGQNEPYFGESPLAGFN